LRDKPPVANESAASTVGLSLSGLKSKNHFTARRIFTPINQVIAIRLQNHAFISDKDGDRFFTE